MTHIIPAKFLGHHIDIIDHEGRRWLSAKQIGLALGYNEGNANTGVTNLYNRHIDEFDSADTCTINLMTQGQQRLTRIFSMSGCNKLGFFASTARAKEFRAWAAKELTQSTKPVPPPPAQTAPPPPPPPPPRGLQKGRRPITRAIERQVLEYFVAGWRNRAIAREIGISDAAVSLLVLGKYQFSPVAGEPECSPELIAAVTRKHLENERGRLIEYQQNIAQRLIDDANNADLRSALGRLGHLLQKEPAVAMLSDFDAIGQQEEVQS
jgi:hypothetical protein